MANRVLSCGIEGLAGWYPDLFVEPHIVAFVAVTGQYSVPPAEFSVECQNISSEWLHDGTQLTLAISWSEVTVDKAERLRATMQSKPLVEYAAVAVALILASRI